MSSVWKYSQKAALSGGGEPMPLRAGHGRTVRATGGSRSLCRCCLCEALCQRKGRWEKKIKEYKAMFKTRCHLQHVAFVANIRTPTVNAAGVFIYR